MKRVQKPKKAKPRVPVPPPTETWSGKQRRPEDKLRQQILAELDDIEEEIDEAIRRGD